MLIIAPATPFWTPQHRCFKPRSAHRTERPSEWDILREQFRLGKHLEIFLTGDMDGILIAGPGSRVHGDFPLSLFIQVCRDRKGDSNSVDTWAYSSVWDFCVCRKPATRGFLVGFHTFLRQCWIAALRLLLNRPLRSVVLLNILATRAPPRAITGFARASVSANYEGWWKTHHTCRFLNCISTRQSRMPLEVQGKDEHSEHILQGTGLYNYFVLCCASKMCSHCLDSQCLFKTI